MARSTGSARRVSIRQRCSARCSGGPEHGRWTLRPAGAIRDVRRRYRPGTLVLETELVTDTGTVRIVDCMPPAAEGPTLVRLVEGIEGTVAMGLELVIRFEYGSSVPWVQRTATGLVAFAGPDAVTLHADLPLRGEGLKTAADFTVSTGQRLPLALTWHPSHEASAPRFEPGAAVAATEDWWREWSARSAYEGQWREEVNASLIVLKALTFGPTGGIVAAPTTSLPEQIGGVRNWDYRYCWLRDAALTLGALMLGGYSDEALAFRDWALRASAGDPANLQIMYGVAGERRLPESELHWLPGYGDSSPVRVGNAAAVQFQLDVYGEVMDLAYQATRLQGELDPRIWRRQVALVEFLETRWREPDEGIWEVRGPRRQFTHSKVMAWVAFDRAIRIAERFDAPAPLARWRRVRAQIHAEVCRYGYDRTRRTFTQYYGSRELDASVLLIPLVGFLPPSDPRVLGTIDAVRRSLRTGGLVARYSTEESDDGLPVGEGAFLACSFWLVENLALTGRRAEALELFERLLALRNDVGLLAEEYDSQAGRMVGNFPQAFTHLALIHAAATLSATGEGALRSAA
jgi:GH15 family glucan-1,4-alpha-glucosidase